MKKDFLEVGKIVGTHGIKGMVRIQAWADDGDFLLNFNRFYLDKGKTEIKVNKISVHKQVVIALLSNTDSIEAAEKLRGKILYINRNDVDLEDGRYFVDELIGCKVFDADTKEPLGVITDVSKTGANDVWHILKDNKEYLMPSIEDVVGEVDIENERVEIHPLKGVFDDEN